jgi:hypothetical protein
MPYANNKYTADGSTATFSVAFPYLSEGDLVVSVDGVVKTLTTDYTVPSTSQITFNTPPANGTVVELKRSSNQSARLVDYTAGAIFKESDLDTDGLQTFYMAQEAIDATEDALRVNSINKYNAGARVITNLADPVDLTDAVSLGFISPNLTNIGTVAGISGDVTTVAGISANVTSVAGNESNINAVQANSANINSAVSNASNINSAVSNATNINTVATNVADVNTVATSIADVNKYADTYFTGGTAPSSPTVGDLWFDTTVQVLKVYTSGGWQHASSAISTSSTRLSYTVGTNSGTYTSGSLTTFPVSYDSGFIDVYLNGVKLINVTDFTATNGTEVVLVTAATAGDVVDFVAYGNQVLTDVSAISPHIANINLVANDISSVTTTATNISNVNAVGGDIANVNTVASDSTNIGTVVTNISDVNTVATNISNVNAVGTSIANVNAVALDSGDIGNVSTNMLDVKTVANNVNNVNAVGGDITNVNTVAGDATNIGIVATNISDINALGPQASNITAVGANITSINAVYSDLNNIGIVATDIANVNAVGASIANVNTVANNMSDVTTVAGDVNDIGTVAANVNHIYINSSNINNINATAGNYPNINTVATNITDVNTVASGISNVNTVANDISNINSIANPNPILFQTFEEMIEHTWFNSTSTINSEWSVSGTIGTQYGGALMSANSSMSRAVTVVPGTKLVLYLNHGGQVGTLKCYVGSTSLGSSNILSHLFSSDGWVAIDIPSGVTNIWVTVANENPTSSLRFSGIGLYNTEFDADYIPRLIYFQKNSSYDNIAHDEGYNVYTKDSDTKYFVPDLSVNTHFGITTTPGYRQLRLVAEKPS